MGKIGSAPSENRSGGGQKTSPPTTLPLHKGPRQFLGLKTLVLAVQKIYSISKK